MKLAAIIVNYRTPDLTAQVTGKLLPELAPLGEFHLYVVDNCSGDGSVEQLRTRAEAEGWGAHVTVVAAPRNGGYGYGINVGVELARACPDPPDYYFIVNSDAFADPGSVKVMLDFMEQHPEAGLCGANIRGVDGAKQGAAFRFPTAISEFNDAANTGLLARLMPNSTVALPLPGDAMEVEWISGTCMLIRRAVFDQIGFFDEGFFLYFEEVDFCRRARRAGWLSYCLPAATITHVGSVSTGMNDKRRPMPQYWFESRHRYFLKHHGRSYTALCDVSWVSGFVIGEAKRTLLRRPATNPPRMFRDFLRNGLHRLVNPTAPGPDDVVHVSAPAAGQGTPPPAMDTRASADMSALELIAEDFTTHDRRLSEPGFWAVATHRFGNRVSKMDEGPVRTSLDAAYKVMFTGIDWVWGIHLPRSVELGRRVRLWHSGCVLLAARSIGDDVQIRHDTTFGPVRGTGASPETLPVIEDRADIGSGACVLGAVRVGHDAVVGANSVVLRNVLPHSVVLGVPARIVPS